MLLHYATSRDSIALDFVCSGAPGMRYLSGVHHMNRVEKRLLRSAINAVAHFNSNAWWELKHQIFEGGYQSDYPVQGDFDFRAQRAVEGLPDETKVLLINEWKSALPPRALHSDSKILEAYARIIVEEVVERARLAAYRTINW